MQLLDWICIRAKNLGQPGVSSKRTRNFMMSYWNAWFSSEPESGNRRH